MSRDTRGTHGFTLIELLIVVAIIGIIAAIAIPSLSRARLSANEAAAIGDARAVVEAATVYSTANGGYYDARLECLATPSACVPGYPAASPAFLDRQTASLAPKAGYARTYDAGPPPQPVPANVSPTSVTSFCYGLTPVQPGRTGVRAFGVDGSGTICYSPNGTPVCAGGGTGELLPGCQPLQ